MRILRLELEAFGPFTGATLELDSDTGRASGSGTALHVVYGHNEAGKSTALRALEGLLFGIPERTKDGHLHGMDKLRVGAVLVSADGERLHFVRRKGRKNTLLDEDGEPLDEERLARLLRGVTRERFLTMFALDHDTLRSGAEALLLGRGDVGESLFDAGFGGRGIHAVLAELDRQAEALFKPSGHKPRLNEAIVALKKARKKSVEDVLSASAWQEQQDAINRAREQRDGLRQDRTRLGAEQKRLERDARVLPQLQRRAELLRQRDALGEAGGAAAADRLAAIPDETIADLRSRLAAHHTAAAHLPRLEIKLRAAEDDARRELREHRDLALEEVDDARIDAATQALVRKLARERESLVERVRAARERRDEVAKELEQAHAQHDSLPPTRDVESLRRAHDAAAKLGDIELRVGDERAEIDAMEDQAATRLAALPLWHGTLTEARRLAVPAAETIVRFDNELATLDRQRANLEARRADLESKRREVEMHLDAEAGVGQVPSETELDAARAERDRLWRELRTVGGAVGLAGDSFEHAMAAADEVADRLRREAKRVARHAELLAQRARLVDELATAAAEIDELAERAATYQAAWRACWQPTGIEPATPREMLAFAARLQAIAQDGQEVARRRRLREETEAKIDAHRRALSGALRAAGADPTERGGAEDLGLADLVAAAAAVLERTRQVAADRDALEAELAKRVADAAALDRRAGEAEAALADWRKRWTSAMSRLRLPPAAEPEEAQEVLDALGRLFATIDRAEEFRRRIAGIRRDAERFTTDVAELVARFAPSIAERSADECAEELERRHREARQIDDALSGVESTLLDSSDGVGIDALIEQTSGVDLDATRARLDEVEQELDAANERFETISQEVWDLESGLKLLAQKSSAEDAAEAEGCLARVREHAHRYLRTKLAAIVLRREIERYREDNQGPILRRASELFPRLTIGAYSALRTGFGGAGSSSGSGDSDEPVLLCVRAEDGTEVPVDGLSDGTRDQLYLALRVASLEHQAARDEPMPFVADDVLIHFDDDRAKAAFEVLGELAQTTDVLFFTHHSRLVELAREAVTPDRLRVHDLDALRVGAG